MPVQSLAAIEQLRQPGRYFRLQAAPGQIRSLENQPELQPPSAVRAFLRRDCRRMFAAHEKTSEENLRGKKGTTPGGESVPVVRA